MFTEKSELFSMPPMLARGKKEDLIACAGTSAGMIHVDGDIYEMEIDVDIHGKTSFFSKLKKYPQLKLTGFVCCWESRYPNVYTYYSEAGTDTYKTTSEGSIDGHNDSPWFEEECSVTTEKYQGQEIYLDTGYRSSIRYSFPWKEQWNDFSTFFLKNNGTETDLPENITTIEPHSFRNMPKLKVIHIPAWITHIGEGSFLDSTNIESITVEEGNPNYRSEGNCLIETATQTVIFGCQNSIIPDGVKNIGGYAFYDCKNLKSITIPDSMMHIEKNAFSKKLSLEKCILAPSSESLEQAKMIISALTVNQLYLPFLNGQIQTNEILKKELLKKITAKTFRAKQIKECIQNNTPEIFAKLLALIPEMTFEEIKQYRNQSLDAKTVEITAQLMEYCNRLYPDGEPQKSDDLFKEMKLADYKQIFTIKKEDGFYVISKYKGDDSAVTIPAQIQGVPVRIYHFKCGNPLDVSLEEGFTSISDEAFSACTRLQSITIPDSVTSIGEKAFHWCKNLQSITIPDSVTRIGYSAFSGCSNLQSITIGNSVTSIGDRAFEWCTNLQSITIPDSVTSIGNHAFSDCSNLQSITIPDSVTSIGESAFSWCTRLQSITIPDSVTSIGNDAFYLCTNLQSITIPDSVTSIGDSTFWGCSNLQSITIPDSVTSIGRSAFWGCSNLQSITIPDSVTSIGDSAFSGCENLQSITIPDSVTSIGRSAFSFCRNLTLYVPKGSYAETYAIEKNIEFQSV